MNDMALFGEVKLGARFQLTRYDELYMYKVDASDLATALKFVVPGDCGIAYDILSNKLFLCENDVPVYPIDPFWQK